MLHIFCIALAGEEPSAYFDIHFRANTHYNDTGFYATFEIFEEDAPETEARDVTGSHDVGRRKRQAATEGTCTPFMPMCSCT